MLTVLGVFLSLAIAMITAPTMAAERCAESTKDYLKLVVSLSKDIYVESEPIIVKGTLVNNSPEPHRLAEPSWSSATLRHAVRLLEGTQPMPAMDIESRLLLPQDYGWDFVPKEKRSSEANVLDAYVRPLPPGKYSLVATYSVPSHVEGVWHGEIVSPELTFRVVEAVGVDAAAAEALRDFGRATGAEGPDRTRRLLRLARSFRAFSDPDVGGVFAPYAGYWEAVAYHMAGHDESCLVALRAYAAKHGDVPVYGREAMILTAATLMEKGDYVAAREVYLQLPDSYERRCRLRLLEERSAR